MNALLLLLLLCLLASWLAGGDGEEFRIRKRKKKVLPALLLP